MEDGLIEIDPEMYITCRLCIEEKGKYQIVPKLQEKIKFAFDIDIKPFDGFSQVMCDKCKTVVTEVCETKEKFQTRQQEMRIKLVKKTCPEQEEVVSNKSEDEHGLEIRERKRKKPKKSRKKVLVFSSSSEDETIRPESPIASISSGKSLILIEDEAISIERKTSESMNTENKERHRDSIAEEQPTDKGSWKSLYNLSYVCRYCNKHIKYKNSIRDHVRRHVILMKSRRKLTRWHSFVQLEKFDTNLNLTGSTDVVVLNPRTIISDSQDPDYYTLYTPIEDCLAEDSIAKRNKDFKKLFTCEDVISDDDTGRPKLRKRIRIQSSLSERTGDPPVDINYSDINESSNDKLEKKQIEDSEAEVCSKKKCATNDYDMIKKIISASVENSRRKNNKTVNNTEENVQNDESMYSDSMLRRKLLSFGRKVMVKSGFSSLGLLKFLEQKNLKIQWVNSNNTSNAKSIGKDSPYVRVQTKWVGNQEINKFEGFQSCVGLQTPINNNLKCIRPQSPQKDVASLNTIAMPVTETTTSATSPLNSILLPALPKCTTLTKSTTLSDSKPIIPKSNLVKATDSKLLTLLNASPVLNPKQAKRKNLENLGILTHTELQSIHLENIDKGPDHIDLICIDSDTEDSASSVPNSDKAAKKNVPLLSTSSGGVCMPIITATESLAQTALHDSSEKNQERNSENKKQWIKCKPLSELRSERKENEVKTTDTINSHIGSITVTESVNVMNMVANQTKSFVRLIPSGHIILHTVSLPNTATNKPFNYFAKLLSLHRLQLVTNETYSVAGKYLNLVKFRLGVHQHPLSVMLCLALEAFNSNFRVVITNKNNDIIEMSTMSAIWQWEVLKAFNSDTVVTKIKHAAEREPSVDVKTVNLFLHLLSSIKLLSDGQHIMS